MIDRLSMSWIFATFHEDRCGDCWNIKARWDNHQNCLSSSSCSRLSTCSTSSRWSEKTWTLAEKRRTYSARSVMRKKKQYKRKRLAVDSGPSHYENTPIKYIQNFTSKNWKFSDKKNDIWKIFCCKHRLWVLVRTAPVLLYKSGV